MNPLLLLLGSAFGAFIGYSANRVAIWMLFHPRRPIHLGPVVIQGVFPKKRREIAENLARAVEETVLTPEDVGRMVSEAIEERLRDLRLPIPLPPATREQLEAALRGVISSALTSVIMEMSKGISVREFIVRKFDEISDEEFERMFMNAVGRELRYIALNDALIGALVGALEMSFLSSLH